MTALIGIIMGSSSDWETMKHAVNTLEELGIPAEALALSVTEHVEKLDERRGVSWHLRLYRHRRARRWILLRVSPLAGSRRLDRRPGRGSADHRTHR